MPNATGRYAVGGTTGTYVGESLPNITGYFGANCGSVYSGAFNRVDGISGYNFASVGVSVSTFNASVSSPIYQDNAKVRPDSFGVAYYVKY